MKYSPCCAVMLFTASFSVLAGGPLILNDGVEEHLLYFEPETLSNEVGSVFKSEWDSGRYIFERDYKVYCNTKDSDYTGFYWSAILTFTNATSGEWHSFDEYWDMKVEFQMVSAGVFSYEIAPFYSYKSLTYTGAVSYRCPGSGKYSTKEISSNGYGLGFPTGSTGRLSLRLKKKIVNGYTFISTPIATLYASLNQTPTLSMPFMSVVIAGFEITLPDKCEINAGQVLEVDFGEVATTRLDGEHYPVRKAFDVSCSGGDFESGLSSVSAEFIGDSTPFSRDYFATDHAGIGILIKDELNNTIKPQEKKNLNLVNGKKNVPLIFAPVAQSSNIEAGEFSASIIIRLLME